MCFQVQKTYPKSAKAIITSNSLISEESFKFWTASMKESGAKVLVHQHGGQYGAAQFYTLEDHETSVSDAFLSWGWTSPKKKTVIPFYVNKVPPKENFTYNSSGKILIATVSSPKYTKYFYSSPLSSQMYIEMELHSNFMAHLPIDLRRKIHYRCKKNYGWNEEKIIKERFPEIQIEQTSSISLFDSLRQTRLFVNTYNATTFLETFLLNIPTVIIWHPEYRELKEEAVKYYEALKKVGILYYSAKELSEHVNNIYESPMEWWSSKDVQDAKNFFCSYFARTSSNIVSDYKTLIEQFCQ